MAGEKRHIPHAHYCTVCGIYIGCEDPNCKKDHAEKSDWSMYSVCQRDSCQKIAENATVHLCTNAQDNTLPLLCCGKLPNQTPVGDRRVPNIPDLPKGIITCKGKEATAMVEAGA